MKLRHVISVAFIYVVGLLLVAVGALSFVNGLLVDRPLQKAFFPMPGGALLTLLVGVSLISLFTKSKNFRNVSLSLVVVSSLLMLSLSYSSSLEAQSLNFDSLSELLPASRSLPVAYAAIALGLMLAEGGRYARMFALGVGILCMFLAANSQISYWLPSIEITSFGLSYASGSVLNLIVFLSGVAIILVLKSVPVVDRRMGRVTRISALIGVIATAVAWQLLSIQSIRYLSERGEMFAERTLQSTSRSLNHQILLVKRMSERLAARNDLIEKSEWQVDAKAYIRDITTFEFIAIVDEKNKIFWVESRDAGRPSRADSYFESSVQIEQKNYDESPTKSSTKIGHHLDKDGMTTIILSRIDGGHFKEFQVIGGVNTGNLIKLVGDEIEDFGYTIEDRGVVIYDSVPASLSRGKTLMFEKTLTVAPSIVWKMKGFHIEGDFSLYSPSTLPILVLIVGGVLTMFLVVNNYLSGVVVERSGTLERSLVAQARAQGMIQRIMDYSLDVFFSIDANGKITSVSPSVEKLLGYHPDEMTGNKLFVFIEVEDFARTEDVIKDVVSGKNVGAFRNRCVHKNGHIVHLTWSAGWSPSDESIFAVAHDISHIVKNEVYAEDQRLILGMISIGRPVNDVLEAICLMTEAQLEGGVCAVMTVDQKSESLVNAVGPSLPEEYSAAINGLRIGPTVGSCGAAAYYKQLVVVEDLATHPNWESMRELTSKFGLKACWSMPVLSREGDVLGTMALYLKKNQAPSESEILILSSAAQLAGIGIKRHQDRQLVEESEQRFRSLFDNNPDPVFSFGLEGNFTSMNGAGLSLLGVPGEKIIGLHWSEMTADSDIPRIKEHFTKAVTGQPQRYTFETKSVSGNEILLDITNLPIKVGGEIVGVFGIAKDITEKERMNQFLEVALARTQRKAEQLHGLSDAAIETSKLKTHDELVQYLVSQVRNVIGAHQSVLSLTVGEDWSQSINAVSLSDKYSAWTDYKTPPSGKGIYTLVCETKQPMLMTQEQLERHPRWKGFGADKKVHPPMRGWLAVPLINAADETMGILQLSDKFEGDFDEDDLAIALQFAHMASAVLQNSKLISDIVEAERRLLGQVKFTQAITDSMEDGIVAISANRVVTFSNPSASRLLTNREEDIVGRDLNDLISAEESNFHWWLNKNYSGGFEYSSHHVSDRWISANFSPMIESGTSHGWVVVLRDISHRRRAEQAMRERDQFFRLSLEMFCMVSMEGSFLQVNPAFAKVLGFEPSDLVGVDYRTLIPAEERDKLAEYAKQIRKKEGAAEFEIKALDIRGQVHWLDVSAAIGHQDVVFCVAHDITAQKIAADRIAWTNQLLSMAGRTARLGSWSVDVATNSLEWSPEIYDIIEFPKDRVPSVSDAVSLFSEEDGVTAFTALQDCATKGINYEIELKLNTLGGKVIDCLVTGEAVRNSDGKIVRVVGAFQDISSRKIAQRNALDAAVKLNTTLEQMTDSYFAVDTEWRLTYINRELSRMLDVSWDQIIGRTLWDAFPGSEFTEIGERYRLAIETKEQQHFESFYAPYGRWYEVHAYPSSEGLGVHFRDITERKEVEVSLQKMLNELERSNRELQEFAYVASHDLQEPLRKIQAFGERLRIRAKGLDEESQDYLQRMSSAASRMQALIIDLLNYSRVSTRNQNPSPVNMSEVIADVLKDMETQIEETGAVINVSALPVVYGDETQMRQVMQNLISNSIKFCAPGVVPRIYIDSVLTDANRYLITVKDNGIGFDEKYLEKIFAPFQRLHGRSAYPGTGIGLAIVKKIIERQGGTVSATSSPGVGSAFLINLPVGENNA